MSVYINTYTISIQKALCPNSRTQPNPNLNILRNCGPKDSVRKHTLELTQLNNQDRLQVTSILESITSSQWMLTCEFDQREPYNCVSVYTDHAGELLLVTLALSEWIRTKAPLL